MDIALIVSQIVLACGVAMGLGALLSPQWAAGVVRLIADPSLDKPGGYSEFRATYGGLLLFLHAAALFLSFQSDLSLLTRTLIVLPIGLAWIGAGVGRSLSLLLDKSDNRSAGLIPVWIPMEFALGLSISAPAILLLLS